jgi:hypothetical protein
MARLTDIAIRNLKAAATRREIPDPGQHGLYVIVQPTGAKVFAVRYRFGGRTRKLTLQAGISLSAARREAAAVRRRETVCFTGGRSRFFIVGA